ncbi:hypothetical protein MXB_1972 [Myxobolus squamalis]|nr:hypothetical protein MXB_1972 [Myxobolus squamalis]
MTIVPFNEINIAIKFIQTNEELKHENWPKFWIIFQKIINERNLQSRTKICLERYNRHLNKLFENAHPNLVSFIAAIKND